MHESLASVRQNHVEERQFACAQRGQGPFQGRLQLPGVFYPLPVATKGLNQLGIVGASDIYSIVDPGGGGYPLWVEVQVATLHRGILAVGPSLEPWFGSFWIGA